MNQKLLKSQTIMAICILILSIIPLLAMGPYLHQFADDYVFGAPVYKAWNATHSLTACIQAAWGESMRIYHSWQGTYSACFLMAMHPGIFGNYWLVPILLLGSLIASTYTLGYMVMRRLLHVGKMEYAFVSTLFVLMTIQFLWSYYDAFFWYNGAMYYTLYYSISLFLASLLIAYHLSHSVFAKIIMAIISIALAIFIAGGNFVTGLGMPAILFAAIIWMKLERKKWPVFPIFLLLIYGGAFAFSVFAPGNAVRQATVTSHPNVVAAFFMAIGKSVEFLADAIGIMEILVLTILAPVLARMAKASRFKFSHPWICLLVSFLLYSAFAFPNSYAMGSKGANRVLNVYFYVHLWMVCFNIYYLSGALQRNAVAQEPVSVALMNLIHAIKQKYAKYLKWTPAYYCLVLVLSITAKPTSTNRTFTLLRKGLVQKLDQQVKQREAYILKSKADNLVLQPLTVKMPSDAYHDITIYPGYWINRGMANYYDKKTVVALPYDDPDESPYELLKRCREEVGPGGMTFIEGK